LVRPLLSFLGLVIAFGAAIWVASVGQPARLTESDGERVYVVDGDTLRIGDRTLRLNGMDAVELRQLCRNADGSSWACGLEARDALTEMVAAEGLVCNARGSAGYGRASGDCRTNASTSLAADLVTQGWAVGDKHQSLVRRLVSDGKFAAEEAEAKAAKRGIWRGTFDHPVVWRSTHPREQEAD
jgi:endonuclease YncB( thermonuclease family)